MHKKTFLFFRTTGFCLIVLTLFVFLAACSKNKDIDKPAALVPFSAAIKVDKNSARIMTAAGHHDSFHTFRHRFQVVSGAVYCN